jgi:hypothetical protein
MLSNFSYKFKGRETFYINIKGPQAKEFGDHWLDLCCLTVPIRQWSGWAPETDRPWFQREIRLFFRSSYVWLHWLNEPSLQYFVPSKLVETVMLLACIREVLGLHLGQILIILALLLSSRRFPQQQLQICSHRSLPNHSKFHKLDHSPIWLDAK